LIAAQ
jgi:hypothetical protein